MGSIFFAQTSTPEAIESGEELDCLAIDHVIDTLAEAASTPTRSVAYIRISSQEQGEIHTVDPSSALGGFRVTTEKPADRVS